MPKQSKFRKLKKFLLDAKVIEGAEERLDCAVIKQQYPIIFNIQTSEGGSNFDKLVLMIFECYSHECIRIKLMILIHFIMLRHFCFCERFQDLQKPEFQELVKKSKSKLSLKNTNVINYSIPEGCKTTNTSYRSNVMDDVSYTDISQYLHFHVTLPYYAYLMKVSINSEFYSRCREEVILSKESPIQQVLNFAWKTVNSLRNMVVTKRALTSIGRYYLSSCIFIIDFIQIMGNDISDMYGQLQRQMSIWIPNYKIMNKCQLQNLLALMQQITNLNEQLFIIFYNRYFHKLIKGIQPQKWLTLDCEVIQKIHFYYTKNYGILDKNQKQNTQGARKGNKKPKQNKTQKKNPKYTNFSMPTTIDGGR